MLVQSNKRQAVKNTVLASLTLSDFSAISSFLEPVTLKERMVLQQPKTHLDHVHFIEAGVVSLRIVAPGSTLETAVVGYRGAVGASAVFGAHIPTHQSVVLFPGSALRIAAEDLHRVINERPQIREHLFPHVQAVVTHGAQTGLCGVKHCLEQRLACWLCLACDALDGHVLPVTHDHLSAALGLRRPGVTEALTRFDEQGLLRKMRGILHIKDHKRLEQTACSCYGIVTSAYVAAERLTRVAQEADRPS
jgi:CRP-like cAMP-binding protein